ncbi:hypothetical protein JKP88DRAFT_241041 [Tribonema minus]|uniref:Uncharacterized protein n=1 Tax=Tribonema minus TaxID=303371 RepID=A0A835Z5D5_9STRA|nr:hypothetical protein JKP88DRAFT_241041 [Tribonema minus]
MKLPWTTLGHFSALTTELRYHAGIRYYRDIDNTPKAFITEYQPALQQLRLDAVIDEGLLWAQHPLEDLDLDIPKPTTLPVEHYHDGFRTTFGTAQLNGGAVEIIENMLGQHRLSSAVVENGGLPIEAKTTRTGAYMAECAYTYTLHPSLSVQSPIVVTTRFELPNTVQLKVEFGCMVHVLRFHLRPDRYSSTVFWYCSRNYGKGAMFDNVISKLVRDIVKKKSNGASTPAESKIVTFRRRSCKFVGL